MQIKLQFLHSCFKKMLTIKALWRGLMDKAPGDSVVRFLNNFLGLKDSTWAPYEHAKPVPKRFRFCEDIRKKRVCPRSQRLRRHCESIVSDNAYMCQHSQQLRGHRVSVVNDYADTHEIILLWKK